MVDLEVTEVVTYNSEATVNSAESKLTIKHARKIKEPKHRYYTATKINNPALHL